ncbi:MAG: hypothetical protein ACREYE_14010 [Gammaproteobacteria bacterium]
MSSITLLYNALPKAIFIALATLALVTTSPAHPVDKKTYPGVTCQAGPFALPGDLDYSIEGYVKNNASGSVWIVCPIVYDVFDEDRSTGLQGRGHGGISAEVRVHKADSFGVICELRSKDAHGVDERLQTQYTFESAGNRLVNFTNVEWFSGGYYVLACIVPPGHSIRSYHVYEH